MLGFMLLASCDGMMQYIDVAPANQAPKLAISATIDTDGGTFRICFTEGRSIGSYRDWRPVEEPIIRKGSIRLYENDRLFYIKEDDAFDLSLNSYHSGYLDEVQGLDFTAGQAYKLLLEIDGYPAATATVVMPDAPIIEDIEVDFSQTVHRQHPTHVNQLGSSSWTSSELDFYPLNIHLTDNSTERDYYMVQQQFTRISVDDDFRSNGLIAISNSALIQDNPDMEAAGSLMSADETDVYLFERMLLSDMSFSNTTGLIDLLLDINSVKRGKDSFAPPCEHPDMHILTEICISHLSAAAYAHYRSLVMQSGGIGFFTEPVSIVSNIENGYGCFSAINTVRSTIAEYYDCGWYIE